MNVYIGTCFPHSIFFLQTFFLSESLWGAKFCQSIVFVCLHFPSYPIDLNFCCGIRLFCHSLLHNNYFQSMSGLGLLFSAHGSMNQEFRHRAQWRWPVFIPSAWDLTWKIWELEARIIWKCHVAAPVDVATALATATLYSLSPCVGCFTAPYWVFWFSLATPGEDMVESMA